MAEIIRYVDTDVSGGLGDGSSWANAHPTLSDWEADNGQNLTDGAGDWMHVYVRGATDETSMCTIEGWTTGSSNYILIEGTTDSTGRPTQPKLDTGKYLLTATNTSAIQIYENYVRLDGLQFKRTYSGVTDTHCVYSGNATGAFFKNLVIVGSGGGYGDGILVWDSTGTATVVNAVVYGFANTNYGMSGIMAGNGCTMNIYSSLVTKCNYGVNTYNSTVNCYNVVSFNNTPHDDELDWNNSCVCDNCASDDANAGTYTDGIQFTGGSSDWSNIFTDYANDDYNLKEYMGDRRIIGRAQSQSYGSPDIGGNTRTRWDIGPQEYQGTITTTSTTTTSTTSSCSSSSSTQSTTSSSHTTTTHSTQTSTTSHTSTSSFSTSSQSTTSSSQSSSSSTVTSQTTTTFSTQSTTSSSVSTTSSSQSTTSSSLTSTSSTSSSTFSTQSTTTSSQSSSSSSTTTTHPYNCICYGEQDVDFDTWEKSWQTWDNGEAPTSGDADWGLLSPITSNVSPVETLPSGNKTITGYLDTYEEGSGGLTIYVRGDTDSFLWNAEAPEWAEYTAPITRDWTYIQWKLTG